MEKDTDELFVEIALAQGLLSAEEVVELRDAASTLQTMGMERTLPQIALEKRLVSRDQLTHIQREMQRQGVRPRIGGYEILRKVGAGGMGVVYEARQVALDRVVAIKVLYAELARDRKYIGRFEREARLAAKVNHPNITQVYDVGRDAGRHYIAMEFVRGTDLERMLEKGPLPEARALDIALGAARALEAAHRNGIVHRDIKPSNIMVTEAGVTKLTDLGVARRIRTEGSTLTRTGAIIGTPAYMAPEQCRGERDLDGRADIYSLGSTLFHMLCGRPPFQGEAVVDIIQKQMNHPVPDPRRLNAQVSAGAAALIRAMMAKDRSARYAGCAELIAAIEAVAAGRMPEGTGKGLDAAAGLFETGPLSEAEAATPAATPRRRKLAVAAGGALLLLAAGLVWALWGSAGGDEPEEPETVRAYTAKYTRAQEMADDGQWADALVAWGEARALAGKLRRKPATYRTLIERIDEAKERLRTTSAPTAAGEAGEGKTAADVGTTPPAAAAPGPKAEAPKAAAAAAAAPKPGHAPAGKAAAATRPTAEPPATRPAAKAEDAEERVRGALQKAGKFRFVGTPLKAVLDEISAAAGVKITCPTETRRILDQPVSTVLVDVTMETALEKVLYPRGLDFEATAEGVVVAPATPESLARKMEDRANRRATQSRQAR